MTAAWLLGLLRRRSGRLLGTAIGIATAVALLAALGSFLAASKATMTTRATSGVTVDWQVEAQPGADPAAVLAGTAGAPGVRRALPVGFARVPALSATVDGATQTTGDAVVLGLPDGYRNAFPGQLRTLAGADTGVLLAQQTAANLRAVPGSTITVSLPGLPPTRERVAGVVELPQANSLFQHVGAPPQAQPTAPPDNVLLLPAAEFHRVLDPLAAARPDLVTTQVHAERTHALPADPSAAFTAVAAAARNLEVTLAGAGLVGDNLGASLDAARGDSLYAQVLFLFLGLPGAVLAGLLTMTVAGAGAARRRREQSLLRTRGATAVQLLRLAAVEALIVGTVGGIAGLAAATLVGRVAFGSARFGATGRAAAGWLALAFLAGLAVAALAVLLPARRDLRDSTVAVGRAAVRGARRPRWTRYGLDLVLLVGAAAVFRATSGTNYALVLAPEGVPSISVSYWAFLGPALFWVGAGLLTWRLTDLALGRGRPLIARLLRPLAGRLSGTVAATLSRQRGIVARAVVLTALAIAFAASTATFNATYRAQAEVDARLTNGADVTVTEAPGTQVGPAAAAQLEVSGVRAVEPLQHRFAYVGADLQDLYGVRPATIGAATSLQDAYFAGGSASELLRALGRQPDGILVSAETVKDFQLHPGDVLRLRIQDARTKQFTTAPFRYVGVAKEFPTAPKDSFLVANASYLARMTGSDTVGAFLVDTGGQDTTAVAQRLRPQLGTSAAVTDIATVRGTVGSSLTAVDLAGLTRVELGFALALAAAAAGLVLALGLVERRRMFALAAALGATRRQLAGFVVGEAAITVAGGLLLGAAIGWALAAMLVKVLTGVFDPPPASLAVPWTYLGALAVIAVAAIGLAAAGVIQRAARPAIAALRES